MRTDRRLVGPGSWWSIGYVLDAARIDPQVEWRSYLDGIVVTGPL